MAKQKATSGFVYIWFDKKHRRFYIGSHWGSENDGYVCSSNWMRDAYRRRPTDFRRKVLSRISTTRADLLLKEYEWLSLVKGSELGERYYNLTQHLNGHWTTEEGRLKSTAEKISKNVKEAMNRPEVREKMEKHYSSVRGKKQSEELVEKRRQAMVKTMAEKFPVDERKRPDHEFGSEEYRANMAISVSESWKTRDKEAIGGKIKESLVASKEHRSKIMSGRQLWNDGTSHKKAIDCPGDGWVLGALPWYVENIKKGLVGIVRTKSNYVMTQEQKEAHSTKMTGRIWINDGEVSKMVVADSNIPEGWKLGRIYQKKKK